MRQPADWPSFGPGLPGGVGGAADGATQFPHGVYRFPLRHYAGSSGRIPEVVRENGDILAHHIEGVPWTEALNDQRFPEALLKEWEGKKLATPPGGKVYLAISPGRGDLKMADKCGPLPKELSGKVYDDPLVLKAYLNYCRRAIAFFRPDYLAIGIEVNEIHRDGGPRKWNAYVALHKCIYQELKKDHQDLPIFASFTLHQMYQVRGKMLEEWQKLVPYNDLVAVSYYPFFVPEKDRLTALDWLTKTFDALQKPYAFVETNDTAERLQFPKSRNIVLDGSLEKQRASLRAPPGLGPGKAVCLRNQLYPSGLRCLVGEDQVALAGAVHRLARLRPARRGRPSPARVSGVEGLLRPAACTTMKTHFIVQQCSSAWLSENLNETPSCSFGADPIGGALANPSRRKPVERRRL